MKKQILPLVITTVFSLFMGSLVAQGLETRPLDDFDAISIATGINATIIQGNKNSIEIETKGIDTDRIITSIKAGRLTVKVKDKWYNMLNRKPRAIKATLTFSGDISAISISSGADVESDGLIESSNLRLKVSSGARAQLHVSANVMDISVSSGATARVKGDANDVEVSVSSGATYSGIDLIAGSVNAKASSGATARVHAQDAIRARASSGGSITYEGSPSTKDIDNSSGGSVRRI
ncbi:MAG: head GIN domain-containing protein [Bacteroidota bacterium]